GRVRHLQRGVDIGHVQGVGVRGQVLTGQVHAAGELQARHGEPAEVVPLDLIVVTPGGDPVGGGHATGDDATVYAAGEDAVDEIQRSGAPVADADVAERAPDETRQARLHPAE